MSHTSPGSNVGPPARNILTQGYLLDSWNTYSTLGTSHTGTKTIFEIAVVEETELPEIAQLSDAVWSMNPGV